MEEQKTESQTPPPEHHNGGLKSPDDSFHSGSRTNGIRREKWPFLVIAVLLVLVGIFGGYFVLNQTKQSQTPTPTPTISEQTQVQTTSTPTPTENSATSDWKVYTNTQSGYSVKYPGENYVRLICPGEELVLQTRTVSDTKDEVSMPTCGRGGRFEIEVVTASSFTEPTTDDYVLVTKQEIVVANVSARKYISIKKPSAEGPIPDYSEDIYFDKGGKKHLIHFGKSVSDDIKNKILSTFKFL